MKNRCFGFCCILCAVCLLAPILSLAEEGSWGQINQELKRSGDWTRIVTEPAFALGEGTPYAGDESITVLSYGSYPSLDGSTVCVPLAMELARQQLDLPEGDLNGFVAFSTTPNAYERLIRGLPNPMSTLVSRNAVMDDARPVDLILVTEPSDEERALAEAEGCELVCVPFCYDAFVFLVNEDNPVTGLTGEQIRDIYTGNIIDWGDVGGEGGRGIFAYQRPKNSGSQTLMENLVMDGVRLTAAQPNFISDGMSDLVEQIGSYDNSDRALGYSFLYYITSLYTSDHIRVLAVNGTEPTEENIRSGAYPYTVNYWAVYRKGNETAERFVSWLISEEGQVCVRQAGYIPYLPKAE